jgi:prolyl oligopeptidase
VEVNGTGWRTIWVLDVDMGKVLDDEVKWARFTSIAWTQDGSGFFYARYPEPKQGTESQASVANHAVYFHAIGTPQAHDRLVYATPDQPNMLHTLSITEDGRYLAIASTPVSATNTLTVVDLQSADWKPRKLVDNLDDEWSVVGNVGTTFFLVTSQDAPRFKVMMMDIAAANPVITDVVPELTSPTLPGLRRGRDMEQASPPTRSSRRQQICGLLLLTGRGWMSGMGNKRA